MDKDMIINVFKAMDDYINKDKINIKDIEFVKNGFELMEEIISVDFKYVDFLNKFYEDKLNFANKKDIIKIEKLINDTAKFREKARKMKFTTIEIKQTIIEDLEEKMKKIEKNEKN